MSLKHRFLLIFIVISVVPTLIVTTFTYGRYTRLANEETAEISANIIQNVSRDVTNMINKIDTMTETFEMYFDGSYTILNDLKKYRKKGNYTSYDLYVSRNNMGFICREILYQNSYVNGIYVFTPSGENIGYGNVDVKLGYTPFNDTWYKNTVSQQGAICISDLSVKNYFLNASPSITFSRALYDINTREFLGVLIIDCSREIFDFTDTDNLNDISFISIVNHNSGATLYQNQIERALHSEILKRNVPKYPIDVVVAINKEKLYGQFGYTKTLVISIITICTIILIALSYFLSKYLTYPITFLSKIMRSHQNHLRLPPLAQKYLDRKDEIGSLYNEYTSMIEEINLSIKENYQNKLITMDAQMRALETQINSHFLYNTLESINSIAEINDIESISEISLALGNMFRYSIKTKSELVPFKDELSHVNNYITIQKIRFVNRFNFRINIDEDLTNIKILKLILQPLIENSLHHGLECKNGKGTIIISAYKRFDDLFIKISDDGLGIPPLKLSEIRNKLSETPKFQELGKRSEQSIGIKNVNSRIQLYYGREYGISIYSQLNKGTDVLIKLPIIERDH